VPIPLIALFLQAAVAAILASGGYSAIRATASIEPH
jgi:hypothetical protein